MGAGECLSVYVCARACVCACESVGGCSSMSSICACI